MLTTLLFDRYVPSLRAGHANKKEVRSDRRCPLSQSFPHIKLLSNAHVS